MEAKAKALVRVLGKDGKMKTMSRQKWLDIDRSVAGKKHVAYSPDGFTLTANPKRHATYSGAQKEIQNWAKQYERQGYYSTIKNGKRVQIPLDKIALHSRIKAE